MRFIPLAMSEMGGEGVCVAGIDIDTLAWLRPVRRKYGCLFVEQARDFVPNSLHEIDLGPRQLRPQSKDPFGRHVEDRILTRQPEVLEQIQPLEKRATLVKILDQNLQQALTTPGRSLFLVRPTNYKVEWVSEGEWRWHFEVAGVPLFQIRTAPSLEPTLVGISGKGCKCTCPLWREFAKHTFGATSIDREDVKRLLGDATLFLTLSLSALEYEKYWLMVAGVHIVGDDRIWL